MLVQIIRNVVFLGFKKTGTFCILKRISLDTGTELFETHKSRNVPEIPG